MEFNAIPYMILGAFCSVLMCLATIVVRKQSLIALTAPLIIVAGLMGAAIGLFMLVEMYPLTAKAFVLGPAPLAPYFEQFAIGYLAIVALYVLGEVLKHFARR